MLFVLYIINISVSVYINPISGGYLYTSGIGYVSGGYIYIPDINRKNIHIGSYIVI